MFGDSTTTTPLPTIPFARLASSLASLHPPTPPPFPASVCILCVCPLHVRLTSILLSPCGKTVRYAAVGCGLGRASSRKSHTPPPPPPLPRPPPSSYPFSLLQMWHNPSTLTHSLTHPPTHTHLINPLQKQEDWRAREARVDISEPTHAPPSPPTDAGV